MQARKEVTKLKGFLTFCGVEWKGKTTIEIGQLAIRELDLNKPRNGFTSKKAVQKIWRHAIDACRGEFSPRTLKAKKKAKKARKKARQQKRAQLDATPQNDRKTDDVVQEFYASFEWRRMRMEVFKLYERKCMCCGARPEDGVRIHVDHIRPLRFFWDLRLNIDNLQVLCEVCNHGKGNWDRTDWRLGK